MSAIWRSVATASPDMARGERPPLKHAVVLMVACSMDEESMDAREWVPEFAEMFGMLPTPEPKRPRKSHRRYTIERPT